MVVGLLEMVDETMAVLEHYLPDYFTGLSRQKGKPCMDERKVIIYFKGFSCCSAKGKCHPHLPSTDGGDSKIFEASLPGNNIDSAIYTSQKQTKNPFAGGVRVERTANAEVAATVPEDSKEMRLPPIESMSRLSYLFQFKRKNARNQAAIGFALLCTLRMVAKLQSSKLYYVHFNMKEVNCCRQSITQQEVNYIQNNT